MSFLKHRTKFRLQTLLATFDAASACAYCNSSQITMSGMLDLNSETALLSLLNSSFMKEMMNESLKSRTPVNIEQGHAKIEQLNSFVVKAQMSKAFFSQIDYPWLYGLQLCNTTRRWMNNKLNCLKVLPRICQIY